MGPVFALKYVMTICQFLYLIAEFKAFELVNWLTLFPLDLLTVSETATEPPQEEGANLNSPKNLALEATFVNHNFSQQVLKMVIFYLYFVVIIINNII